MFVYGCMPISGNYGAGTLGLRCGKQINLNLLGTKGTFLENFLRMGHLKIITNTLWTDNLQTLQKKNL